MSHKQILISFDVSFWLWSLLKQERRRTTLHIATGILSFVMENNNCSFWCIALRFHWDPQPNNDKDKLQTLRAYDKDKIKINTLKKNQPMWPDTSVYHRKSFHIVQCIHFVIHLFRWVSSFYHASNWMHSLVLSVAMCLR